jgi:hypothetical protein
MKISRKLLSESSANLKAEQVLFVRAVPSKFVERAAGVERGYLRFVEAKLRSGSLVWICKTWHRQRLMRKRLLD